MCSAKNTVIPHSASRATLLHPWWVLLFLSLVSLESYRLWSHGLINTSESGLLEVGQNIFLLLACLLYSYHSYDNRTDLLNRLLYRGLGLVCLALLLRELDVDKLGGDVNGQWEILEWFLRSLTALGLIIYGRALIRHLDINLSRLKSFTCLPGLTFIYLGALCYLCSWPFDKSFFGVSQTLSAWIEETLELNATILFFYAACIKFFAEDSSLLPDLVNNSRG